MTKTMTGYVTFFLFTLFLGGCTFHPDSVPLSDADYCQTLPVHKEKALSDYTQPFQSEMQDKTGVYVLEHGDEAMRSRAWLTEHAEKSIDVQYFIFSVDKVGLIATDYLVRAADRGVKVRVLIDDITLQARGDELLMLSAHDNIDIKIFNPKLNIGKNMAEKLATLVFDFQDLNRRMHNKVFIADDQVAITGGRNIADEYFGLDPAYDFRDRDVFLAGKVVKDLKASFEEYWQYDLSVPVEKLVRHKSYPQNPDFPRLHAFACNPDNFSPQIRDEIEKVPATFKKLKEQGKFRWLDNVEYIADKPNKNDRKTFLGGGGRTRDKLAELAGNARHSLVIQTPYLVTTRSDRAFLKKLIDKGVDIKILTNSLASNDNLEAFSGYQRNRKALLNTGVEIFEFRPDAKIRKSVITDHSSEKFDVVPVFGLHAKTMTVDDEITVVGTYNFDPRSANLNTESITVIHSPEITQEVKASMLREMAPENAWAITQSFNPDQKVSPAKRLGVKMRRIVPKGVL
ncbi:putative cardiolipin synthase YwiE [Vibrio aerogenes CECT 7868]|uniref:Putative cardiolipin synthase YwiE n=1 Tax=Vibrio aerogenes CECT 7868 TaxID=1216006 RepID=A0A1M6A5N0_9VIBR|nr:phospholipase D family protein [Vibrio aerogenes]SHI31513.1 putative cardiolipin synthase YwiE [Vibrio aerogenes CECT 7868]